MADSNSINLAINTVTKINEVKRSLRSVAEHCLSTLSAVDSLIVNQEKKTVLIDGLNGLSVDPNDLKAEKDSLVAVCNKIKADVPELTE